LNEAGKHFAERSAVFGALRKITGKLESLKIQYAVAGGMALFAHGYRRFTEHVDILVKRGDLAKIHGALEGLGYLPPFAASKNLRDTELGVRIEFLLAGDYPGDGKPKPVAFPDPGEAPVAVEIRGIKFLALPTLIELKLASGQTNPARLRDLADVLELIGVLKLDEGFAERLNPFVREKYRELLRIGGESGEKA
jgi:hypothetical protein